MLSQNPIRINTKDIISLKVASESDTGNYHLFLFFYRYFLLALDLVKKSYHTLAPAYKRVLRLKPNKTQNISVEIV